MTPSLKGTVSRDFLLLVFFMNQFHPRSRVFPSNSVSIFFKNSRRYSQVKVHHRYQRHQQQIFPPVSLVLLPPVLTTPVANNANSYQTADNWKWTWNFFQSIFLLFYQRCPKEIIKEDFFHLPRLSLTPVVHLELRISPESFRKNSKQPYWYNKGLGGNWFMKKTRSKKSRETVPLSFLGLF
jgi:hypothetical protein